MVVYHYFKHHTLLLFDHISIVETIIFQTVVRIHDVFIFGLIFQSK